MGSFRAGRLGRAGLVVVASGTLATSLAAAGPAQAGELACGTTITASVTLTQDMDCGGPGIIVGAAGVTVAKN